MLSVLYSFPATITTEIVKKPVKKSLRWFLGYVFKRFASSCFVTLVECVV